MQMFADGKLDETIFHPTDEGKAAQYQEWADAPVSAPASASVEAEFPAMLDLRELADPEADPGHEPEGLYLPLPYGHTTGSQLRHRFVTAESIAELADIKKPSLWQRLLGRK
ncbi:hypothetical protein [Novosphingobium sp. HR1a]|nr:hypothetical protein [Novosphingobium sp. HR1a]MBF7011920.1 hypothetical protein [Novosphingobium sp. HR1a]